MSRLQPAEGDAVAVLTYTPGWIGTITSIDAWGVTITGTNNHELIVADYDEIEPAGQQFTELGINWWI